jgi:hypothetical protein
MMNKLTKKRSLVLLITIMLVIGCLQLKSGWVQSLKAQTTAGGINVGLGDGSVRFISPTISGTTLGQVLRFCLGVKADLIQKTDASAKLTIELFNQQGEVLLVTDFTVGGSLRFKCMNISNSEIPGAGEIGTLRKQVLVQRTLELRGIDTSKVVESFEIVNLTGETAVRYPKWSWMARVLP